VQETSDWQAGTIVRESYFSLVPRDTPPGEYEVRLSVFDGASGPERAREEARNLIAVGHITVR